MGEPSETGDRGIRSLAGKYLTFQLSGESYGFPVLKVREIICFVTPTLVPQLPPDIKGVINLRGKIVPVVDLRLKFGLIPRADDVQNCIVVVQVAGGQGGHSAMGVIVDGVEEVAQIAAGEVEAAPSFGAGMNTDHILGMAKLRGAIKTLVDIDKVLSVAAANAHNLAAEGANLTTVAA